MRSSDNNSNDGATGSSVRVPYAIGEVLKNPVVLVLLAATSGIYGGGTLGRPDPYTGTDADNDQRRLKQEIEYIQTATGRDIKDLRESMDRNHNLVVGSRECCDECRRNIYRLRRRQFGD